MKVFTLAPGESWICDRFVEEWNEEHSKMKAVLKTPKEKIFKEQEFEVVNSPKEADVVQILYLEKKL